tara:strand:+ start:178 stop:696 length:519 start_codon:yes stop_codon:yes gene_type:complete
MRYFFHLPTVFLLIGLTCCKELAHNPEPIPKPNKHYDINVGEVLLRLELARTPSERELGLMHRGSLNKKEGMLFIFETPQFQRFWMKNTRIPLDIGYFSADGYLKEIHHGRPFDLTGMPSRSNSLQFVVELGADEFRDLGIKLGDRIDLEMISNAILSSGGNPANYNLATER